MKRLCVKYHKLFLVLLLVQVALLLAACGPLTWLTDAMNILPIVAQMAAAILTLIATLSGGAILPVDIAAMIATVISGALAGIKDIEAMVAEYKANPQATTLAKIKEATQAVIDHLDAFITDTLGKITNQALSDKIKAMVVLILNEVVAFASLLPGLDAKAGQKLTIVVPMSTKDAKSSWNAILTSPSGDATVDAALATLPKL